MMTKCDTSLVPLGSVIKMVINFSYQGSAITLDDVNYVKCTYYSPYSKLPGVTLLKEDLIRKEEGPVSNPVITWYAVVDTSLVGTGQVRLKMEADIPDADAPSQYRREIGFCDTNVSIF